MQIRSVVLLVLASALVPVAAAQDFTWKLDGTVLDSVTKKPIAGVTVYLDRDPPQPGFANRHQEQDKEGRETVSGSDGRFVFPGLSPQNHLLYLLKSGYISSTVPAYVVGSSPTYSSYVVESDPEHPKSTFFLTPAAIIEGRVTSESGAVMKEILMTLLSGGVQDGRLVWKHTMVVSTDAAGRYVFPNLPSGKYVVISDWVFDNDPAPSHGTECSAVPKFMPQSGYPPAANPGVLDFSKAEPFSVKSGQTQKVDLRLPHRAFHSVTWEHETFHQAGFSLLRDSNGRPLERAFLAGSRCGRKMPEDFQPIYTQPYRTIQNAGAMREVINLPDGTYMHRLEGGYSKDEGVGKYQSLWLGRYGQFTVAGKALTLTYPRQQPLPQPAVQVHTHVEFGPDRAFCSGLTSTTFTKPQYDDGTPGYHNLWLSRADPLPEAVRPIAMDVSRENKSEFSSLEGGSYWVHGVEPANTGSFADHPNTYIASVTAGGVDMADHPLLVGPDGTAPALDVTLRNDCGILTLKYAPPQANEMIVSEPPSFYGILVPQFSAFENVHSYPFEVGRSQELSIGDLTPGHYKLYVSPRDRGVPFREPAQISPDLGRGEDIWLKPREPVSVSISEPVHQ